MQQEIGFFDLFQGCLEAFDEVRRQILNKPNCICQENFLSNPESSRLGVEGRKEFIGHVGLFIGEGSEEGGFPGIGVSD